MRQEGEARQTSAFMPYSFYFLGSMIKYIRKQYVCLYSSKVEWFSWIELQGVDMQQNGFVSGFDGKKVTITLDGFAKGQGGDFTCAIGIIKNRKLRDAI